MRERRRAAARARCRRRAAGAAPPPRRAPRPRLAREAPQPPWAPFPLTEICILIGRRPARLRLRRRGTARPLIVFGLGVVTLATLELSMREHLAGYRSHSALLAAIAAMLVAVPLPRSCGRQGVVLIVAAVVFLLVFQLMRELFTRRSGGRSLVATDVGAAIVLHSAREHRAPAASRSPEAPAERAPHADHRDPPHHADLRRPRADDGASTATSWGSRSCARAPTTTIPGARHFWFGADGAATPGGLISFLEYPQMGGRHAGHRRHAPHRPRGRQRRRGRGMAGVPAVARRPDDRGLRARRADLDLPARPGRPHHRDRRLELRFA